MDVTFAELRWDSSRGPTANTEDPFPGILPSNMYPIAAKVNTLEFWRRVSRKKKRGLFVSIRTWRTLTIELFKRQCTKPPLNRRLCRPPYPHFNHSLSCLTFGKSSTSADGPALVWFKRLNPLSYIARLFIDRRGLFDKLSPIYIYTHIEYL